MAKFIKSKSGVVYQEVSPGMKQALCFAAVEGKAGRIINMPSGSTVVQKEGFALASLEQVIAVHSASPNPPPAEFLVEGEDGSLSPYVAPPAPDA